MRVSRAVTVSLLAGGLLAVPVVSFTVLGGGEPARMDDVVLDGVDRAAVEEAPGGLVVAASGHGAGEAGHEAGEAGHEPGDAPEVVPTDAEPAVLTPEIETEEFSAVGFTWDASTAEGVVVQARVREDGGWSEWFPLPASDEGPDAGTVSAARQGDRAGTDLLLTSGADGVQVRADAASGPSVDDLRAVLIDPGTPDGAQPVQIAGASDLPYISRAQWGAGGTPTGECAPTYSSDLKAAVVHHTVSTNSYTAAQSAGLIRSIWLYHTRPPAQGGRGWCDIGYNAIVDRYGQIFEGAAGGLDRAVIGAHAGGFNTYTFGVSTLGEFENAAPTAAMTEGVAQTIAWKFGIFGINPTTTTQLTSAGGGTAKYAKGTVVTLPVVMGHRDVGATACPGRHLYDQVGAIRARVNDLMEDQGRTLLRTVNNATVYVVSGSMKYPVGDLSTLASLAPLGPVGYVSQQYLDRRTTGPLTSRFVLAPNGTVFFFDSGIKLALTSCPQVADFGGSCGSLVRWEQPLIDALHTGPLMAPIYRTTTGKAFYVAGGVKREAVDDAALVAAGLPTHSVRLQEAGVAHLPYGPPVLRDGVVLQNRSSSATTVAAGGALVTVSEAVAATALSSLPVRPLDEASMRFLTTSSATGAFVQEAGGSRVFLLTGQGKKVVTDPAMAPASVPQMPAAVLGLMPDAGTLDAGTFVKGSTSSTVFALRAGQVRGIGAWADLIALNGGDPAPRILVTDQRIADLLPRGPMQRGPGTMVVSPRNATVYLVDGYDGLIPVSSFTVTGELGASRLTAVPATDIDAYTVRPGVATVALECAGTRYLGIGGKLYTVGADVAAHYPALTYTTVDATTCAALAKGGALGRFLRDSNGTIFYVEDGLKRPITSIGTYLALGGNGSNTIQASAYTLSLVPNGALLSSVAQLSPATAPAEAAPSPDEPTTPAAGSDTSTEEPTPATTPTAPATGNTPDTTEAPTTTSSGTSATPTPTTAEPTP